MMAASMPLPFARLIAPRRGLVSCVPAYVVRSTLGTSGPGYNHYPATPLCSVCWPLYGPTAIVEHGVVSRELVAQAGDAVFGGPQPQPWTTWNPGPTHFFVALFYPDALHALAGVDLSACVGKFLPAEQVLGAPWQALGRALIDAASDEARAALLDDFLEPRWRAARSKTCGQARQERVVLGDWVRRLAVLSASSGIGRSVRVAERRIRAWAGLPMRTLQRMGRAEQALLAARAEQASGKVSWVDVAADAGYADQSHLARETRALTGLSPTALAHVIEHDDSYWMYRIWS
jgi:AraC-like DNA-binding protein